MLLSINRSDFTTTSAIYLGVQTSFFSYVDNVFC